MRISKIVAKNGISLARVTSATNEGVSDFWKRVKNGMEEFTKTALIFITLTLTLFSGGVFAATKENVLIELVPQPNSFTRSYDCEAYLSRAFFPLPNNAMGSSGQVDATIKLTVDNLLAAYRNAIFPWGSVGNNCGNWCTPAFRGVLEFSDLYLSQGDRKDIKRLSERYPVTYDRDFEGVIAGCAQPKTSGRNWISNDIRRAYTSLHRRGNAHSVEAWDGDKLIGGLYFVEVDGVITGESIFNLPDYPKVGKLVLFNLIRQLTAQGFTYIDIQENHGLLASWNAKEVAREDYVKNYLWPSQAENRPFMVPQMPLPANAGNQAALQ